MFSRTLRSTCLVGCLAATALAQVPVQDTGFSTTTAFPDPDLVVVRERAYGAGGIDLTSYGVGAGLETYVQSLYFRIHTGSVMQDSAVNGLVVFPEDIHILGFITGEFAMGGSLDDGVGSETDGIFGITSNPDDYSAPGRGLESTDQVCSLSSNTFVFAMEPRSGVDDFRVIIGYGDFFVDDLGFDVFMSGPGAYRGVDPSPGIRIGDDLLPGILGSGDFGEVMALAEIPLTSDVFPYVPEWTPTSPWDSVYIVRNTDAAPSAVNAFDLEDSTVLPVAFRFESPGAPVGMTAGPDRFLYTVGVGGSLAVMDVLSGSSASFAIPNMAGSNVDLTNLPGTRDLYVLRDTAGDTVVDRLDVDTMTYTEQITIPSAIVARPVGITDGLDGMIYVLDRDGNLLRLDPSDGALTSYMIGQPSGTYVALTRDPSNLNLYLLRKDGDNTVVDRHLPDCAVVDFDLATVFGMTSPADISYGPEGLLYLIDEEVTASPMAAVHPDTGAIEYLVGCVDFIGDATAIAFTEGGFGESYCSPAVPNSTGESAWISVHGSRVAGEGLVLAAWSLPPQRFGYFLTSMHSGEIPFPGGSQGTLCLDLPIGRFNAQIQNTGDHGRIRIPVDTNVMPLSPVRAVLAGEHWYFQCWYRDVNPVATSNFTNAIRVLFE